MYTNSKLGADEMAQSVKAHEIKPEDLFSPHNLHGRRENQLLQVILRPPHAHHDIQTQSVNRSLLKNSCKFIMH